MIGSTQRQASLFYFAFAKEASAIKDVTLDELDELLQDGSLLDLTSEKLGQRCLRSKDFGRPGIAPDRLLRCVVLKHLKCWSFRELEYELRHSLLYRRFTRFFEDPIPDFTSFSRTFGLFGPEGTARAAKYRLLEICRAAKSFTEASRARFRSSYEKLLALTGQVRRQAGKVLGDLSAHRLRVQASNFITVLQAEAQLRHYLPLVDQVMAQTQARIFQGQTRHEGKILSLFEEHSAIIRKGKPDRPTEFGRLVRLDEVENGVISGYSIAVGNPADQQQWVPALEHHRQTFGRLPRVAAADRGFWSSDNEKVALDLGIPQVVLPATGRLSAKRSQHQKQRWFRQGQGWRAGVEPRISTLKHQFGMKRARYKGDAGFQRYVGWCIIVQDLVAMARCERKAQTKCRSG